MADDAATYKRRQTRMVSRMLERAQDRDPALEQNLFELMQTEERDNSWA